MKTVGRFVVVGWLLLPLVLLGMTASYLSSSPGRRQQRCWFSRWARWSASNVPRRCSTDHSCPSPTGSPTTSGNRSALWSPQRKLKPPPMAVAE